MRIQFQTRADLKLYVDLSHCSRIAIARSALMSCITMCRPSRIETNPGRRSRSWWCAERGHYASGVAGIKVFVLMELGVPDPVPALNAKALPDLTQQGF